MKCVSGILHSSQRLVALVLVVAGNCLACAPTALPTPMASPTRSLAAVTPQPTLLPAATAPAIQIPRIPEFDADFEFNGQPNLGIVYYYNSAGTAVARFDPNDRVHNQRIKWDWEKMSALHKSFRPACPQFFCLRQHQTLGVRNCLERFLLGSKIQFR